MVTCGQEGRETQKSKELRREPGTGEIRVNEETGAVCVMEQGNTELLAGY